MRGREIHQLYREASDREETSPREALRNYKRLEVLNKPFAFNILFTATTCPILAFFVAHEVAALIDSHRTVLTILTLITIGFLPPLILFERRYEEQQAQYSSRSPRYPVVLFYATVNAVVAFLSNLIILVIVALFAAVIAIPLLILASVPYHFLTGSPFYWESLEMGFPMYVQVAIIGACLVFSYLEGLIGFFLDVPPLHGFVFVGEIVRHAPAAIRAMAGEILLFLASLAIAYVLSGIAVRIPHGYAWDAFAGSTFTGVVLAVYYTRRLEKDYIFGNVLRIAEARCLVRLGREDEAHYRLRGITKNLRYPPEFSRTPVVHALGFALKCFIQDLDTYRRLKHLPTHQLIYEEVAANRSTVDLSSHYFYYDPRLPPSDYPGGYIGEATSALETAQARYIDMYVDSIDRTRRLVGLGNDPEIERLINASQYRP